jgi:predicted adenine nucleotide alpha hydrolase (AANH) superfamily ATPase
MMKKLLLHVCCAPCSAYSVTALQEKGYAVRGHFDNPNIHPFPEYLLRSEALSLYSDDLGIDVDFADDYRPEEYFRVVVDNMEDRCRHCYTLRLTSAARRAREIKFDAFSTTLLYSIYQDSSLLREVGEKVAAAEGVPFAYHNLRLGWDEGCRTYKETGLYRQNYCGCIFSEKERMEARERRMKEEKAASLSKKV